MATPNDADAFERDIGTAETPSRAVVGAVCAVTNREPIELPPLSETLDANCLDGLFRGSGDPTVSFTYRGYSIEVEEDVVRVRPDTE